MLFNKSFSKPLALTASLSLAALAFAPTVKAQEPSTQSYQIAQAGGQCAQVTGAVNGLNIRRKPTTNSRVIGGLYNGQRVAVEGGSLQSGWAALVGPQEGYVHTSYLRRC